MPTQYFEMELKNRTVFITGASRGIGKAIALKLAQAGANIVVSGKSVSEDARLGGTIYQTATEIEALGRNALAIPLDVRHEDQIQNAVQAAVDRFGGIDVLINNASAIQLLDTAKTDSKKFDLMHQVNVRGSFLMAKYCLPFLQKGQNPHIITLSPPISLEPKWLGPHVAYTLSKYGMTMLTLGWAEEFKPFGIACNTLWPVTTIDTAAVRNLLGGETLAKMSRKPEIMADAVFQLLQWNASDCSGQCLTDEMVLKKAGIDDFTKYSVVPGAKLYPDLFL